MSITSAELVQSPAVAAPAPATERAGRSIRGFYRITQQGRLAIDGSVLDQQLNRDHVAASAWHLPTCEFCWRPEKLRMIPPDRRWCPRHGTPTLSDEDPYAMDPEGDEWIEAEAQAWDHLATRHGVPWRNRRASFRELPTPAMKAAQQHYESNGNRAVILEGGVGCGKSFALTAYFRACLIENAAFDARDTIAFYAFPQLVTLLLGDDRAATLERCCTADELIIDDWGSTYVKQGGMVAGMLEEFVIAREAHAFTMLASTNLSPSRFRKRFGERIYDRLRGSWGAWLNVHTPSLRGEKG
jgi:hypothetical protein